MFTGIVSAVGEVVEAGSGRLGVRHPATAGHLNIGASVAVNGCCLTVVELVGGTFFMEVVPETLRRTDLGSLTGGSRVNLELPLSVTGLLDGHLVQGHVDSVSAVIGVVDVAAGREVVIGLPHQLRDFVVEKGSIAVDGVSLTVAALDEGEGSFKVAFIPHTLSSTIAGDYKRGSVVNLEADIVARYVARNLRR